MRGEQLSLLVDDVVARIGRPIDRWAVAATLESRGIRDVDAAERFGFPDVFALADAVYERALGARKRALPAAPRGLALDRRAVARAYLRGAYFFVPLGIQMLSLVALGFSQWASLDFTLSQASVVAVAVGASFVITAGASQALGFLAPIFDVPGRHALTERMTYRVLAAGAGVALGGGAVLALLGLVTDAYPADRIGVGMVYYALLAAMWLITAALYATRGYAAMAAAALSGIAVTWSFRDALHVGIYAAHWAGLGASVILGAGLAAERLRRAAMATHPTLRDSPLPRIATLARRTAPYACYGTLYFSFLFIDRVAAWTAGHHPLPVWLSIRYEVGLDWALISVVLGMALLEVLVTALPEIIDALQERTDGRRRSAHNRAHGRYHVGALACIVVFLLAGIAAAWWGGRALVALGAGGDVRRLIDDPVTRSVFLWGAPGYALLVVALGNAVVLFSLSRPWPMVGALIAGIAVDAAVGFILSRTGPPWHAVIGLTAGAVVVAIASYVAAWRVVRQADFAYYASF